MTPPPTLTMTPSLLSLLLLLPLQTSYGLQTAAPLSSSMLPARSGYSNGRLQPVGEYVLSARGRARVIGGGGTSASMSMLSPRQASSNQQRTRKMALTELFMSTNHDGERVLTGRTSSWNPPVITTTASSGEVQQVNSKTTTPMETLKTFLAAATTTTTTIWPLLLHPDQSLASEEIATTSATVVKTATETAAKAASSPIFKKATESAAAASSTGYDLSNSLSNIETVLSVIGLVALFGVGAFLVRKFENQEWRSVEEVSVLLVCSLFVEKCLAFVLYCLVCPRSFFGEYRTLIEERISHFQLFPSRTR
jgi:hypothetical protein